jgi:hypothetical protein
MQHVSDTKSLQKVIPGVHPESRLKCLMQEMSSNAALFANECGGDELNSLNLLGRKKDV